MTPEDKDKLESALKLYLKPVENEEDGDEFTHAWFDFKEKYNEEPEDCIREAARAYLSQADVVEELKEARKKATKGEWVYHTDKPTGHCGIAIDTPARDFNIANVYLDLVGKETWEGGMCAQPENKEAIANADFIATAANGIQKLINQNEKEN